MSQIKLSALTTIRSAKGELIKNGKSISGSLSITTDDGIIDLSLAEFDAIYRGFVNLWPAITPLKTKVIASQKALALQEKKDARIAAEATRKAEVAARKAERIAEAIKRKAERKAKNDERIAKAKKAKADKVAKAKAAKAAKAAKKAKGNKTAALEASAAAIGA